MDVRYGEWYKSEAKSDGSTWLGSGLDWKQRWRFRHGYDTGPLLPRIGKSIGIYPPWVMSVSDDVWIWVGVYPSDTPTPHTPGVGMGWDISWVYHLQMSLRWPWLCLRILG